MTGLSYCSRKMSHCYCRSSLSSSMRNLEKWKVCVPSHVHIKTEIWPTLKRPCGIIERVDSILHSLPSILYSLFVTELSSDSTIRSHLAALYDTLLEQNLLRIVEPYSVVEIEYVAQMVGQARQAVEAKYASLFLFLFILELMKS